MSPVRRLELEQNEEAVTMLARAFVTNPLHLAAFGAAATSQNEAFFRIVLRLMKGSRLAVFDDSRVVGLIHWVSSPGCRVSKVEKFRLMPALLSAFGLKTTRRLVSWLSIWGR